MTNTTKATKRIELGVNTKSVKVQFNTSTPVFREVMGNYWVAVVELADMTKIYANNVRIFSESVAKLTEKAEKETLSTLDSQRLELDTAQLKEYTEKFNAYRDEMNKRFDECSKLIVTSDLYTGYNAYACKQNQTEFRNALKTFLATHNIESTDSLMNFLLSVVGMRKAPANTKVKSKGTTLLIAQTERAFNELFMHALSQLMVDKNCIKTDNYKFTYEKASVTHIESKIDTTVVPKEEKESTQTEEVKSEKKTMTKKQLMEVLEKAGVAFKKSMKLSELVDLYNAMEESTEEDTEEVKVAPYPVGVSK